jgi:hypothetical protein
MMLILNILILLLIVELIFVLITQLVSSDFQWFITKKDEYPQIDEVGLSKFLEHGFDPLLGWVRKPNTSHDETGVNSVKTTYHIGEDGARENPRHSRLKKRIVTFGDSFCFCRQNNDETTWQWYLSELSKSNVSNYGVGNYGLDQSLMRLKLTEIKPEVVILCVVPSTIVRCLCVWKHYNEYGNTLGFKPRYDLKDGNLVLIENVVKEERDFRRLRELLPLIQKNDYFYDTKFKREMICFPYTYHFLKNPIRNFIISSLVLRGKREEAMMKIMKINLKLRIRLYRQDYPTNLLLAIIKDFELYAKKNGFKPVLMIIPQKDDVEYIRRTKDYYYKPFLDTLRLRDFHVIDVTEPLLREKDLDCLYSDDNEYGGHPCPKGNEFIATYVKEELRRELRERN